MSEEKTCLSLERGDGVAVLMHDPVEDTVVLVDSVQPEGMDPLAESFQWDAMIAEEFR